MPRTSMIQRGSLVLRQPPSSRIRSISAFPDEWNYTFGIAVAAHPKLTLGFDIRGRTIRDMPRFVLDTTTYPNRGPGLTLPTASVSVPDEFVDPSRGNLNQLLGVIGGKINLGGTFLLNLTLLVPMNDAGLKPNLTPVVGFDYVF